MTPVSENFNISASFRKDLKAAALCGRTAFVYVFIVSEPIFTQKICFHIISKKNFYMIKIHAVYSGIYQTFIRKESIILFLAEKSLCSDLILTIPVAIK